MAEPRLFHALKSQRICREIDSTTGRVIYAAPGVRLEVARSLVEAAGRLPANSVTTVLDCDEETCRLGYGEIDAIKMLEASDVCVRQSPGLRVGLLICDDRGWSFSPVALYVEDEPHSDETTNAARLLSEQLEAYAVAICPGEADTQHEQEAEISVELLSQGEGEGDAPHEQEAEIGVELLSQGELERVDASLKVAPPMKFDVMRQVRVFQPYIQYVELHLKGCSINRKVVNIPNDILNRNVSEELEERLKTKFNLISRESASSDKKLQEEVKRIRDKYIKSLGQPWKSVMLRNKRDEFDKEIKCLKEKVKEHQALVEENLQKEIDASRDQVVEAFWQEVVNDPPDDLVGQIMEPKPDEKTARDWLKYKLNQCFPRAEQIVCEMKLECQFSDVTYETLTQDGFVEALRERFQFVPWDQPLREFEALRQKEAPKEPET